MSSEIESGKDPTRLCPVCRMPISILAVRCRFCGAEVGRPRKEQETFTVKDLGGEQKSTYTLSGNVTEALEAFISEERAQIESKDRDRAGASRKSLFRRGKANAPAAETPQTSSTALPDLDATNLDLSASTMSSTRSTSTRVQQQSLLETVGQRTLVAAAVVAGLILLYFGTDFAWARIRHFINPQSVQDDFIYPNRAEDMYASGIPLVEVLNEAVTALRHNDTEENRSIAEKIRRRFIESVEEQAFATPFNMEKLNAASAQISRAGQIDNDSRITQAMEEISRETAYFKFILTSVDEAAGTAVFRLNNPFVSEREQEVSVGDLLQDRFLVKRVSLREVILEDAGPRGAKRQLIARRLEPVAPHL